MEERSVITFTLVTPLLSIIRNSLVGGMLLFTLDLVVCRGEMASNWVNSFVKQWILLSSTRHNFSLMD